MIPARRFPRLLLPLLVLASAGTAAAQIAEQTFEDTSQVVAVEVPVNVVDRDGKPVRGLTVDDFEVFDAGQRQKLSGFEVVDLRTREAGAAQAEAAAPDDDVQPLSRRYFLLLFDFSFSSPTATLKARMAARDFLLGALHPTDLAAVATYSVEHGPQLVVTFTPDRAQLARAIDTLGMLRGYSGFKQDPLRFMVEPPVSAQLDLATSSGRGPDLRAQEDQAAIEYMQSITNVADRDERNYERSRITTFTKALSAMAKTLNSVPGRKHVVFFSEGFDSRLLMGRSDTSEDDARADEANAFRGRIWMSDNDQRYGNTELQGDVNRMLEEFKRADCVVQAVDIGGLRTTAETAGGRPRTSGQEALFYIANETGGELFKDTNNLGGQLESVLERTSVTYLLTFERSDLKLDGSYHRLRVKAKMPSGARLSHRVGYYEPRPFKELDPLEKSLLAASSIMNAEPRRDLDLNLLVAPFRSSEKMSYVPVIIEVPGRKLLEGHNAGRLNVEFYGYVNDRQGAMLDYFSEVVSMDIGRGRQGLEEGGIKYYGHFDLAPGDYRVRVLVRNADTGRTVVTMVPVQVPAYTTDDPVLLPPFFMEEQRSWVLVRESSEVTGRQSVVYPFTVNGEPYVPSAKPTLKAESQARLCLVAYNLAPGDVAVDVQVTGADGKALPGGRIARVERTATGISGVDKLLATFEPTGLAAGDYVLQIGVTNSATGQREHSTLPFQVVAR
jgi:VWFA-related protein